MPPHVQTHPAHPKSMSERKRLQNQPSNDRAHADWEHQDQRGNLTTGHHTAGQAHHSPAPGKHRGQLTEDPLRGEK
jgi:hypothetical protein